jgi:dipeptidyl aminopeptidase/acylaminoacyl peptidase
MPSATSNQPLDDGCPAMSATAPYGSWNSPITTDSLVEAVVGLSNPMVRGDQIWWTESRPTEGGRLVLVRRDGTGTTSDAVPEGFSVRTLVHEYGGACSALLPDGGVLFSNFADQRVWRVDSGAPPRPITPESGAPMGDRYADFQVSPDGRWVVAVHEAHLADEVRNQIVAFPADGSSAPHVLVEGHDFFAAPRLSPDGGRLAWLSWDHPNMPWDATTLYVADVTAEMTIGAAREVAGGPAESVNQPRWSPQGILFFTSDRTGWWNLYADEVGGVRAVLAAEAEFSGPDWVFGQSSYTFLDDGTVVVSYSQDGVAHLVALSSTGDVGEIPTSYSSIGGLVTQGDRVVAVAGSPVEAPAIVAVSVVDGSTEVLRRSRDGAVRADYLAVPVPIEFPTAGGMTAHGLFYPPTNGDFVGPAGERPPLIVMSHGGPTCAASSVLDLRVQFFTSRGLAVVDVDYGGSSGYGRAYRKRLEGQWGVVDVDDCVNAALWLADQGLVDATRMAVRGGSAGGYTTLAALTFRDVFAVGASHYGVADVAALAKDTHKFESRYLDGLIGPWPAEDERYAERSPIHHTDQLSCPIILFQGLEDKIVPPDQARAMADALRRKGIPFALLEFEGEQHGFRRAETTKRVFGAELWFYGRVLGFVPADVIEPVTIENVDALPG